MSCKFCMKHEPMMSIKALKPSTVSWAGGVTPKGAEDLADEISVFIDARGYLRLVDINDCQCLDHGQKIKISYCPVCGENIL